MDAISQWLRDKTFHHSRFADIRDLVRRKEEQGLRISLCLPTLNEGRTIGPIVSHLRQAFQKETPLLDEIAVIDSGSSDRTLELAAAAGAEAHRADAILPEMGIRRGKGENLWKSLYQLRGDIFLYLDADVTNMHTGFVTGLLGPLLHDTRLGYVKAFYERAPDNDETGRHGGGRVTEILARPFLSLFYPELAAFIQPLSGEYAARRGVLDGLAFPAGYGVELAHLIDLYVKYGMGVFAQADLGHRAHRPRSNHELGRMSYALLQVLVRRVPAHTGHPVSLDNPPPFIQFRHDGHRHCRETYRIIEVERPPMREVAAYRQRHALSTFQPAGPQSGGASACV